MQPLNLVALGRVDGAASQSDPSSVDPRLRIPLPRNQLHQARSLVGTDEFPHDGERQDDSLHRFS